MIGTKGFRDLLPSPAGKNGVPRTGLSLPNKLNIGFTAANLFRLLEVVITTWGAPRHNQIARG